MEFLPEVDIAPFSSALGSIGRQTSSMDTRQKPNSGLCHRCFGKFYLASPSIQDSNEQFACFSIEGLISYIGFCDDFGPFNLSSLHQFCELVDNQLKEFAGTPVAMITAQDPKVLTNAVFLVGSYMIMKLNMDAESVDECFQPLHPFLIGYRDVSPGEADFSLHVSECWGGLWKAKSLQWVDFNPGSTFDIQEYTDLDNPLNADMHEIVPGKFFAMRGPRDLPDGRPWMDMHDSEGRFSHRDFSPQHYALILHELNVCTVVRLNEPQYEMGPFRAAGIAVADLCFEDCTPPPVDVVAKFLTLAERVPGAIAVHCKAGLGRTGTLIALYMMKHHGFSAREAMGWLRIVRPGSVIGDQQHFLCAREGLMRRESERALAASTVATAPPPPLSSHCSQRAQLAVTEGTISRVFAEIDERMERALRAMARKCRSTSESTASSPPHSDHSSAADAPAAASAKLESSARLAAHVSDAADRRNRLRFSAAAAATTTENTAGRVRRASVCSLRR